MERGPNTWTIQQPPCEQQHSTDDQHVLAVEFAEMHKAYAESAALSSALNRFRPFGVTALWRVRLPQVVLLSLVDSESALYMSSVAAGL
jgi:hypothetical protein